MHPQLKHTTALVVLALAGCASAARPPPAAEPLPPQPARVTEPAARAQSGRVGTSCPTDLGGTTVFATPLEDGAAMLFIAPSGPQVDELRRRVHSLARTPGQRHAPIAAVDDIQSGARLKLTPRRPDELGDVQRNVFDHAQRLVGAMCPLVRDELRSVSRT